MRKQFQGNSVKENKEGLEQGEQVERRIERAREIKRERGRWTVRDQGRKKSEEPRRVRQQKAMQWEW
jgi:hypothetical protein